MTEERRWRCWWELIRSTVAVISTLDEGEEIDRKKRNIGFSGTKGDSSGVQ